jgi:HAMP domain-containing protein
MMALIAALFAKQIGGVSIKAIITALSALFIVLFLSFSWVYVKGLNSEISNLTAAVAVEKEARIHAEILNKAQVEEINRVTSNFNALREANQKSFEVWLSPLEEIKAPNTTETNNEKTNRLNSVNNNVNRMLERESSHRIGNTSAGSN